MEEKAKTINSIHSGFGCFFSKNWKQVNFCRGECLVYSKCLIHVRLNGADTYAILKTRPHFEKQSCIISLRVARSWLLKTKKIICFPKGMGE